MKTLEYDLHITELIGKPYFECGKWCQLVQGIVNYKKSEWVVTNRDYQTILDLKVKPLSTQQPGYLSNVDYI